MITQIDNKPHEKYTHKDEWYKKGEKFSVIVSKVVEKLSFDSTHVKWRIHLHIYHDNPCFKTLINMSNCELEKIMISPPFNKKYAMFKKRLYDKFSEIEIIRFYGNDGTFECDTFEFSKYETPEEASQVFTDANEIYEWISNASTEKCNYCGNLKLTSGD